LGLTPEQVTFFNGLNKVEVKSYDKKFIAEYPHFYHPKTFAWKTYILKELSERSMDNLIYIDSGACFVGDTSKILDVLDTEHILYVGDTHINEKYTHTQCFDIMKATPEEKRSPCIWAGFQAYKTGGKYQNIINEAFEYAKIKECIEGSVANHRHDQSIFSILSVRYKVPRQDIQVFGEYRGKNVSSSQIIYAHRNTFHDESHLIHGKK
jgi:hypothetical protein